MDHRSLEGYHAEHTFTAHTGEVTGLDVHPTNEYFVTGSLDRTWCLHQIETGTTLTRARHRPLPQRPNAVCLVGELSHSLKWTCVRLSFQVSEAAVLKGYSCLKFHPDGLILGTGTVDSFIRIWDIKLPVSSDPQRGHCCSRTAAWLFRPVLASRCACVRARVGSCVRRHHTGRASTGRRGLGSRPRCSAAAHSSHTLHGVRYRGRVGSCRAMWHRLRGTRARSARSPSRRTATTWPQLPTITPSACGISASLRTSTPSPLTTA